MWLSSLRLAGERAARAADLRAAQRGDLPAFNRLVAAHQQRAYHLACRLLGDEADAATATQAAVLNAWRGLADFPGGSFGAWLLRHVAAACQARQRPAAGSSVAGAGPTPFVEAESVIRACLSALPPELCLAVVLVDLEGLDYPEAAELAGMPLGALRHSLAQARQAIHGGLLASIGFAGN